MKQKNQSRLLMTTLALAAGLTFSACASKAPQGEIASNANPQDEIARLDTDLRNAKDQDVDVLDFKNFDKSVKYLEEAKQDLAKNKKQEEILNDVRFGRESLNAAKGQAEYRRTKAPTLLEARQAALKAGVMSHPELQTEWTKTDREVIAHSEDLSKVKIDDLSKIQSQYVELERKSVIATELGDARSQINGAEKDGAKKKAPQSFKTAQIDNQNAESVISTNVRNPAGYKEAATKANASARMLTDVMNTIKQSGAKNLPEATAISMVMQNRQIADLKNDLSTQKTETATAESQARAKEMELSSKNKELKTAEKTVAVQQALEKARKEFSAEEAEAYQQGSDLVIRLKTMSFPSGRADLPPKALPVLAKVSDVAKELGAAKIRVEGHTDSIGGEQKNKELSEKRAESVATYLKTTGLAGADVTAEGFGLSKPLASNKSQAGRAQNRRVDIIITPEKADGSSTRPATTPESSSQE